MLQQHRDELADRQAELRILKKKYDDDLSERIVQDANHTSTAQAEQRALKKRYDDDLAIRQQEMNDMIAQNAQTIMDKERRQKDELERAGQAYAAKINANTTKLNNFIAEKNSEVDQMQQDMEAKRREMQAALR